MERITRETIKVGQAEWRPAFRPKPAHAIMINGCPWFYRLRADNGLYPAGADVPPSDFVVCWQVPKLPGQTRPFVNHRGRPGRLYGKFVSSSAFVRFMDSVEPDAMHFFEVIPDNEQRARFDLDMTQTDLRERTGREDMTSAGHEAITQLQQAVATVLRGLGLRVREDLDFTVCQSHGPQKQSYHLICNGFKHGDHLEARAFYDLVMAEVTAAGHQWLVPFVDQSIYPTVAHFRPLWSTKPGHQRWKVIDDSWPITWEPRYEQAPPGIKRLIEFNRTAITNVTDSVWVPIEVEVKVYPEHEVADGQISQALALLDECLPGHPFKYLRTDGPFVNLLREQPSYCPVCQRTHEAENPYILLGPEGQPPTWFCRRSGGPGLPLISRQPAAPPVSSVPEAEVTVKQVEATSRVSRQPPTKRAFRKPRRDLMTTSSNRELVYGKPRQYWLDLGSRS